MPRRLLRLAAGRFQLSNRLTLIIGSQVRALVRRSSSPRKPQMSETTPNRAFLRGFLATHFLGLWSRGARAFERRFLVPCLCIQKFRFRRPGLSAKSGNI